MSVYIRGLPPSADGVVAVCFKSVPVADNEREEHRAFPRKESRPVDRTTAVYSLQDQAMRMMLLEPDPVAVVALSFERSSTFPFPSQHLSWASHKVNFPQISSQTFRRTHIVSLFTTPHQPII
jgi:hypothetical protein